MTNARSIPCDILYRTADPAYDEAPRTFQGCPTIAVTKGGRIYLAWYAGGIREPDMRNYNLVVYSDDKGATWSKPLLVIPSSTERWVHSLDIQLWTAPDGRLFIYWVQNATRPADGKDAERLPGQPWVSYEGWIFDDFAHNEWLITCDDPDAADPVFSEPRWVDIGFLRCKPTVTNTGRWINFNYDQLAGQGLARYGYSISDDEGKTFTRRYGAKKIATNFDEAMAYQREDGSIRMLARAHIGELAESISYDNGDTWTEAVPSGIDSPASRFWVGKLPSGRVLLITNDHRKERTNMAVLLSEDDGATWKYKRIIDTRNSLSYPDADVHDGEIYMTYDREREGAREILFLRFTEADIMNDDYKFDITIASKPSCPPAPRPPKK